MENLNNIIPAPEIKRALRKSHKIICSNISYFEPDNIFILKFDTLAQWHNASQRLDSMIEDDCLANKTMEVRGDQLVDSFN